MHSINVALTRVDDKMDLREADVFLSAFQQRLRIVMRHREAMGDAVDYSTYQLLQLP